MFWDFLKTIYAIGVVLLLFNLAIFVHELGHFWIGRRRGAKIERFAIWFGAAIWKKTIGGVEFRLGWIPLGGYVAFPQLAMESVEGASATPAEELKPLLPRDKIPILLAGSAANVLLGFVIACVIWVVGVPKDASEFDLKVGHVPTTTVEDQAGIRPGDRIYSIDGHPVHEWSEIVQRVALSLSSKVRVGLERDGATREVEVAPAHDNLFRIRRLALESANTPVAGRIQPRSPAETAGVQEGDEFLELNGEKVLGTRHLVDLIGAHPNQPIRLTLLRAGKRIELTVTPRVEKTSQAARIGVALTVRHDEPKVLVHPTPWRQIMDSLLMMANTLNAILHTRTTGVGMGDLSGPVGIFQVLYELIRLDFRLALAFMVLLNINLAVINLLPIPVLDGGHIVFSLIEAIRKKPLNPKWMEAIQTVFVALLLTFFIYVTFNDIARKVRSRFGGERRAVPSQELPAFEEKTAP